MKARRIAEYLKSLDTGWVRWDQTVDTFKSGSPEAEVNGIAVGWMSYTWALQKALDLGCNMFITHEPTYYDHMDNNPHMLGLPTVQAKRKLIEENNLVILRCHDLWDQLPELGIPDSWGAFLGLGEAVAGKGYDRIYDVSGLTAGQVAVQVAVHTRAFGQEAVQLIGSADQPVSRVSIGTGAITPFLSTLTRYEVDLAICTDDGFTYWRDGAYAIDMGIPVIVVHHHVSEEAGMLNLAKYLQSSFPKLPVHHIPQQCMYRLVQGK